MPSIVPKSGTNGTGNPESIFLRASLRLSTGTVSTRTGYARSRTPPTFLTTIACIPAAIRLSLSCKKGLAANYANYAANPFLPPFQQIPIPAGQICRRLVCCLQKIEKGRIRRVCFSDGIVRQQEFTQVRTVERRVRVDRRFRKTTRLRISI